MSHFLEKRGGICPLCPPLATPLPWTLGEYTKLNGGSSNRSKKSWGIYVPFDIEDDMEDQEGTTADSVSSLLCSCVLIKYMIDRE